MKFDVYFDIKMFYKLSIEIENGEILWPPQ